MSALHARYWVFYICIIYGSFFNGLKIVYKLTNIEIRVLMMCHGNTEISLEKGQEERRLRALQRRWHELGLEWWIGPHTLEKRERIFLDVGCAS